MRKKQVKKLLALGLCLAMAFSAVACGNEAEETKESSAEQKQEESESQKESSEEVGGIDTSEAITLTLGLQNCEFGNGVHTEENEVLKAIKEKFNVELEFVVYDDESLSLMAAGGDLPDMLILPNSQYSVSSRQLADAGQLLPLDDLLEKYGQNILENTGDAIPVIKHKYESDVIYALTSGVSSSTDLLTNASQLGFSIRYDVWKAIGAPEMDGWDSALEVFQQMQEYERERTGSDDVYAISAFSDWGTWPWVVPYNFSIGYGNYNTILSVNYVDGTLEVNITDENSRFWESLEFYNKAWNMGLCDPDMFTQKYAQYKEKIVNGKLLVNINNADPDPEICGEDACFVQAPIKGTYIYGMYNVPNAIGDAVNNGRAITVNCEYPERAMQIYNWLDSQEGVRFLENGPQGVTWDYVDGVPQYIGELKEMYLNGEDTTEYRKKMTGDGFSRRRLYTGVVVNGDGYGVDLEKYTEGLNELEVEAPLAAFSADYGCEYPGQVYEKWVEEGIVNHATEGLAKYIKAAAYMPANPTEWNEINTEATNYFMANVAGIVMAADQETFNQAKASMIAKFEEIGTVEVADGMIANYNAGYEKLAEQE